MPERRRAHNSTLPAPTAPMTRTSGRKVNRKRRAKLFARNFGEKGAWCRSKRSCVSGRWGTRLDPMVASHAQARGMGGCGGDLSTLVPMLWSENQDYSDLPETKWLAKYGVSKARVREMASECHAEWLKETQ